MSKGKAVFLLLLAIGLIVFTVGCIVCVVSTFVHAIRNPELTFTQNILFMWENYKIWILGSIVDYLLLGILG